jgi:hypothetical protein
MTASGQYNQQMKHASALRLAGMQVSVLMIGRKTLQNPVLPPSPGPGWLCDVL